jgi:transposase
MLRMDEVYVVRHKVLVEGQSVRRVAHDMGIARNTVRKYLKRPAAQYGPRQSTRRPVSDAVGPRIEALLEESASWTSAKQRLTATRLHQMLVVEGVRVGVTTVKELVAEWKRRRREVFVPLMYAPGDLGEVDFFEVLVDVGDTRRKAWMFVMRLMHSGRDFACIYERQDQVCFLDGHVRAFEHFGAVPHRLAYDNLRAAVKRILVGSERELQTRFLALASHYLFEACFCRPRTGHDKGGVESRGRGIRLQHLVPIPSGQSFEEINRALLTRLDAQADEARFSVERAAMLPLLAHPFLPHRTALQTVTRRSLITVEGAAYSVPCAWAGLEVTVRIGASSVEVVGRGEVIARHPRLRSGQRSVDYRHYLPELAKKPQAVRQIAAELARDLGAPFDAAWRSLVDVHGPRDAARVFAKILGHIETRGLAAVACALDEALGRGEPLLLALAPPAPQTPLLSDSALPQALRVIDVESGRAADYDSLIGGVR